MYSHQHAGRARRGLRLREEFVEVRLPIGDEHPMHGERLRGVGLQRRVAAQPLGAFLVGHGLAVAPACGTKPRRIARPLLTVQQPQGQARRRKRQQAVLQESRALRGTGPHRAEPLRPCALPKMQRGGVRHGQDRGVNGGALARARQVRLEPILRSEIGVRKEAISGTGLPHEPVASGMEASGCRAQASARRGSRRVSR